MKQRGIAIAFIAMAVLAGSAWAAAKQPASGATAGTWDHNHSAPAESSSGMNLAANGALQGASRSPQSAPELVLRGRAKQESRDWKGALADFERALQLDPKSADAYAARGQWWATDGKDKKALADFERALAIDATHRDAHFFRATARERAGDLAGARADYAAVLAVDPAYAQAAEYLADVEQRLGSNASSRPRPTRPSPTVPPVATAPRAMPSPSTAGLPAPPGNVIEARMPPKGPNEVNIALIGAPAKRDVGEDLFYRQFGQMRGIDFILQASSAKDVMPTLAKLKRSGKRVKTLIIAGHGDQNQAGIQISSVNDILKEWDVDRELMAREVDGWKQKRARVLSNLCPLAGKTERTGAEIQQRAALEKQLEIADAQIADWERVLQDAEDAYGVMAPDGFIMLFNCFAAADESHLAFSKALARTLFGNNRGKLMVSATAIQVQDVNSTLWSTYARAMEGYWHPIGDTFVTGAWRQYELEALPATTPATKYLAVHVKPAVASVTQAIATTSPTVSPQPDSGNLIFSWSGACGNAKGPSCSLDTSRIGNKGLFSSTVVRDTKGREGSEAFCQVTTAELLIGVALEPPVPALGQPFVARAQVTRGTQPPNTYWLWRTSGAVTLASKDGALAQLTTTGEGAVQALLFGYGAFGKEMVFGQVSVPVSPARGAARKSFKQCGQVGGAPVRTCVQYEFVQRGATCLVEGVARVTTERGQPLCEVAYRGGVLDGVHRTFHDDGRVGIEGAYSNGKRTGQWTGTNAQGKLEYDVEFRAGEANGRTRAYKDGKLAREGTCENGRARGRWREWRDGALIEEQDVSPAGSVIRSIEAGRVTGTRTKSSDWGCWTPETGVSLCEGLFMLPPNCTPRLFNQP
jgi:tetratricopeptide (TPR) repeat protein